MLAGTLAVASCMQVGMLAGGLLLAPSWQPHGGCSCMLVGMGCGGALVGALLAASWWLQLPADALLVRGPLLPPSWQPHGGCSCAAPVRSQHAEVGVLAVGHLLVDLHKLQPNHRVPGHH